MILTVGNRLRGTNGTYSKVIGLLLAYVILAVFADIYVSLAILIGYIGGEALYGWGEAVGNLCVWRKDLWKWRIYLTIRGLVWWIIPIMSLYFVGVNTLVLLSILILLSIGFPLSCEIGYQFQDKLKAYYDEETKIYKVLINNKLIYFTPDRISFTINSPTELMETSYGLIQDIAILIIVVSKFIM